MRIVTRLFAIAVFILAAGVLQACKHPLAIVGEGDIVDTNNTGHGCTLEQFLAQDTACSENEVDDDYFVNYKAEPRSGSRFVRWEGPCSANSDFQHCRLEASKALIHWWEETYQAIEIPPSTAVFQPITGETGYLAGPGSAVAGVAYKTATQQGATGLDGRFQYEKGETVRFMIGDTWLGEVTGQSQVTPFDLAGSAVLTGTSITRAIKHEDDPFQRVINIAVLLQSMDHDANPDNGIQIRPGISTLFKGVNLDLGQPWLAFLNGSTLRHAIGQANMKHRFSEAHEIVKPAAALDTLYQALGVDARTVGISLMKIEDENGNVGRAERFRYDADGYLIWHDDGTPDAFETWRYDAEGNLIRYERNSSKYGSYDIVETSQYDSNGNVTRKTRDYDADGSLDEIFSWRFQYNRYGNVARMEEGDDTSGNVETWQYDNRGHVTRKEEDWNADGTPDNVESWQYNNRGYTTRKEQDYNADGSPDDFESFRYNSKGYLKQYESDNGSGWYELKTWRYDARGNVTQIAGDWGHGHYGSGTYIESWQYDSNTKLLRKERVDSSGILEQLQTWQYNSRGKLTRATEDSPAEGSPSNIETWRYEANGKLKKFTAQWLQEDGTPDGIEAWQYDSQGNAIRAELDYPWDDPEKQIKIWYYDGKGNVTRAENRGGDGIIESAENYQYEATGWGHLFTDVPMWPHGEWPPLKPGPDPSLLP